jgi:hypothetical protein
VSRPMAVPSRPGFGTSASPAIVGRQILSGRHGGQGRQDRQTATPKGTTSVSFDPVEPSLRRFTGYGPATLPDPRDTEIDEYLQGLRAGGPSAVAAASAAASEKGRQVLGTYAERSASLAVRTRAPDRVVAGLIAVVVGGLDQNDREALVLMPLLEDAARRLGLEPADLFEEAAEVVGHPGTVNLMLWLSRRPEDRTLECMGYEAGQDDSGFRYRWSA